MAVQAQGIASAKSGGRNEIAGVQCGGAERVKGDREMPVEQGLWKLESSWGSRWRSLELAVGVVPKLDR